MGIGDWGQYQIYLKIIIILEKYFYYFFQIIIYLNEENYCWSKRINI